MCTRMHTGDTEPAGLRACMWMGLSHYTSLCTPPPTPHPPAPPPPPPGASDPLPPFCLCVSGLGTSSHIPLTPALPPITSHTQEKGLLEHTHAPHPPLEEGHGGDQHTLGGRGGIGGGTCFKAAPKIRAHRTKFYVSYSILHAPGQKDLTPRQNGWGWRCVLRAPFRAVSTPLARARRALRGCALWSRLPWVFRGPGVRLPWTAPKPVLPLTPRATRERAVRRVALDHRGTPCLRRTGPNFARRRTCWCDVT